MALVSRVELEAVVWDFGGVLNINTVGGRFLWSRDFETDFGQPRDAFEQAVFGDFHAVLTGKEPLRDRVASWIKATGVDASLEEIIDYWLSRDTHLDTRLLEMAEAMAGRGLRQVVAANADPDRAAAIETVLGDWPGIDTVFASCRMGVAKPDPDFFRRIAEALGVTPGALILIDDGSANVNAAARAGWRSFRYSKLARDALRRVLPL